MNRIAESELILNQDGSIYHLHLLPADLADIVITVGDPDRVEKVADFFQDIELKKKNREFETITGWFNGVRMSVISTGISTANIDIVLNELDALVNVDLENRSIKRDIKSLIICRIGTCGGIDSRIEPGFLIVSEKAVGFDNLFDFYPEAIHHKLSTGQYMFEGDVDLIKAFSKFATPGNTATIPGFYAPQGRSIRTGQTANNWLTSLSGDPFYLSNMEMETSAIYGLSAILGHRAVSVSAVLANRITGKFTNQSEKIISELIEQTLLTLCRVYSKNK